MRARLIKEFRFEAAHTLPSLPEGHKCRQMHGHSFKVEIAVEGEVDEEIGWVYDHKRISDGVHELREAVDLNPSHAQAHAELGFGKYELAACVERQQSLQREIAAIEAGNP